MFYVAATIGWLIIVGGLLMLGTRLKHRIRDMEDHHDQYS